MNYLEGKTNYFKWIKQSLSTFCSLFNNQRNWYIFFYSLLTVTILFGLSLYLDSLPANEFVINSAESFYSLREFFLVLMFRVAPILVPIILATTSLMLNKYNEAFFKILIKNNKVQLLVNFLILYLLFHMSVIFITRDNIGDPMVIRWYVLYLVDTILVLFLLLTLVFTIIEVYSLSVPTKLINYISEKISKISTFINDINYENMTNQEKSDEFEKLKLDFEDSILKFRNITVTAIKSKDYNTVKESLNAILDHVWQPIIGSYRNNKFESNTDGDAVLDELSNFVEFSEIKTREMYKEIFDTAYDSKEYNFCDQLISNLLEVGIPKGIIYEIYLEMFRTVLRLNHNGYSTLYCSKISSSVKTVLLKHSSSEYKIVTDLIQETVDYENPKVLKKVLLDFREIIQNIQNQKVERDLYRELHKICLIALSIKSMDCFEQIIKFAVTKGLEIKIISEIFSSHLIQKVTTSTQESNILDNISDITLEDLEKELEEEELKTPYIEDNNNFYLSLKCYFIFISYYFLQNRISKERIQEEYRDINITEDLLNRITYDSIRTLFLDLQTYLSYWDKMFVSQGTFYFTFVAESLLEKNDVEELNQEVEIFNGPDLLTELSQRIKNTQEKSNK